MSAIENKKLIQEIYAAAGNPDPAARDRALFTASLADDATWTVTGQYSWSRTFAGKDAILNDLLEPCPLAPGRAGANGRASFHCGRRPRRGRGEG